jgi:hypothetical protein
MLALLTRWIIGPTFAALLARCDAAGLTVREATEAAYRCVRATERQHPDWMVSTKREAAAGMLGHALGRAVPHPLSRTLIALAYERWIVEQAGG